MGPVNGGDRHDKRQCPRDCGTSDIFPGIRDTERGRGAEKRTEPGTLWRAGPGDADLCQYPNEKQETYIKNLVRGAFAHGPELDDYISRYAVGWSFERIPRMAAAIMRTAMYEILYMPDIPNAAAINAAVELTKQYEPQEVAAFVNGILGSFVRAEFQDTPAKPEKAAARTETAPEA